MAARTTEGLRTILDADDAFLSGHQIMKLRRQKRPAPEWARHSRQVRGILLRSFPRLDSDPRQRVRAGRWARIIHLYFVLGHTYSEVAEELREGVQSVRSSIQHISNASRGRRANGSGVYANKGVKKRGRRA